VTPPAQASWAVCAANLIASATMTSDYMAGLWATVPSATASGINAKSSVARARASY
jgi:hypothetical protein